MDEIWKDIEGFPGYKISNLGVILGIKMKKPLKLAFDSDGYNHVSLSNESGKYTKKVHRLVAEAFLGKIPDGKSIDHIDGCKTNNCVSNLRFADAIEQALNRQSTHSSKTKEPYIYPCKKGFLVVIRRKDFYASKTFKTLEEAKEYRQSLL